MNYYPRIKDKLSARRALYKLCNDVWRDKIELEKSRELRMILVSILDYEKSEDLELIKKQIEELERELNK